MGNFSIVVPEAGTNLLTNPSVETGTTGFAITSAGETIARSTADALFGTASLLVTTNGTTATEGAQTSMIAVAPDTSYAGSFYIKGTVGDTLQIRLREFDAGSVLVGVTAVALVMTGAWQRIEAVRLFGPTGVQAQIAAATSGTFAATFYVDGWQLEAGDEVTTYMDGEQAGCSWNGTAHASTTTRSGQSRAGGVIRDLDDYSAYVAAMTGIGMPPVENVASPYGLLPGQLHQRTIARPRVVQLATWQSGSTLSNLHALRRALLDAIKPDLVTPVQPLLLRYTGAATEVELTCRYDAGMEFTELEGLTDMMGLRLIADDPYWHGIGTRTLALALNTTLAVNRIAERTAAGAWDAVDAGVAAGTITCAVYGPDGALYVGGTFTTIGGVAANRIAKWDGAAWSALGSGTDNQVTAIAFNAAGVLYAGGGFANAGGASANYIATWNGSAWAAVAPNTGTGPVNALAFDTSGTLYIGGNFTNWAGIADADNIVRYLAGYLAMGTGANGTVEALAVDNTGTTLYAGGAFTSMGGVANTNRIARWGIYGDPATTGVWRAMGSGVNNTVSALAVDWANGLYLGGAFTDAAYPYLAYWNGTAFQIVGTGVNGAVTGLTRDDRDGSILVGGAFTSAGGSTANAHLARFTGLWTALDIDLPGTPAQVEFAVHPSDGRMAVIFDTTGNATTSSTVGTGGIVNAGSAEAAPVFIMTGPGTVEIISNWSTTRTLWFNNLTLAAGERATLDLTPGNIRFYSNTRSSLLSTIAPTSDVATFRVQPGANVIAAKVSGTTGASAISMTFREAFWSVDV